MQTKAEIAARKKALAQQYKEKGFCRCGRAPIEGLSYCERCREAQLSYQKSIKQKVVDAYGGKCQCVWGCDVKDLGFLSLDHVNNDGKTHRLSLGRSNVYADVLRQGCPDIFQVLCYNCNFGRAKNKGICPHIYRLLKDKDARHKAVSVLELAGIRIG